MKNVIFYMAVCFTLFGQVAYCTYSTGLREGKNDFVLNSAMLSAVDGKSYGVDGQVFGLMLQNRRELRKRLYGIAEAVEAKEAAKKVGMYDFCGKKYCLLEIVEIEQGKDFKDKNALLESCLEKAKEDFISITQTYVAGVNAIKDPLFNLIEEFCEKKGVKECFLLKWGEAEAGQEEFIIRKDIKTLKDFAQLCIDLADFLEVLAKSCPKGKALFVDMVKKAKSVAR